ncbi:hypothetical protein R3P38DRAFT_2791335 [Favolaschia claudopus]|uniref:Uncharacterized protein n=1 Tax=Favolaschia claudopus TaxID=2862362 RepID=A0AAW0AGQ0_9AGAR
MRPMRAVRLQQCNSLNRWVGSIDFPAFAAFNPETLLHDDQALCQMWISRSMDRTGIPFHQLCFRISHPRAGETRILSLGQFTGEFADTNAPLWLRRLTPERHYRFPLSRERAAQLIGGLTDIRVKDLWTRNVSPDMIFWAMKTAAGTPTYTELLYT